MPAPASQRPKRQVLKILAWLAPLVFLMVAAVAWLAYRHVDRMPSELLRYAQGRLYGHTKLETVALPIIAQLRSQVEREVPADLPTLGKGAQAQSLAPVRYDGERPRASVVTDRAPPLHASVQVASLEELQRAMQAARPGSVIELLPGRYAMRRSFSTPVAGTSDRPITVRAATPRSVEIQSSTVEGFVINQPFWVFENLTIQGTCGDDGDCEHAFHVVGAASGTVIRNNLLQDFNAHIKINGLGGRFPDDGLVQFNTIENRRPRETRLPVTPIDLVTASRWVVADNVIANFHKTQGNGVSYGVFMKGGGSHGVIERNLVICSRHAISAGGGRPGTGARVGISLGGGGTGPGLCRTPDCLVEHQHGLVVNNVVAHCNDAGIDVNRSTTSLIVHNTLVNTGWIDVRNNPASATVYGNWFEGKVRSRNGGWVEEAENETSALRNFTAAPDALILAWTSSPLTIVPARDVVTDFCNRPRTMPTPPGALGIETLPCAAQRR